MICVMACLAIFVGSVSGLSTTNAVVKKPRPSPSSMNAGCIAKHCPLKMARAIADPEFYKCTACELGCDPFYYNDTSPEKLKYQNCTTKCALTYESPAGDALLGCAMTNNCITFAPLNTTCPKPDVDPTSSLEDLSGEWWQQYGKNPLWDCYQCQHIHSMSVVNNATWCAQTVGPGGPVQSPCFSYTYSYDLYTETSTKYFQQTWQLPGNVPKGNPIGIYYLYMGSTHNETWYILKKAPRYVVLVDCSYMGGWTNVGSILWVRPNVTLSASEMAEIKTVYHERMGWNFPDDFCKDQHGHGNCTEPSPQ